LEVGHFSASKHLVRKYLGRMHLGRLEGIEPSTS
jgi:hypothetical protein